MKKELPVTIMLSEDKIRELELYARYRGVTVPQAAAELMENAIDVHLEVIEVQMSEERNAFLPQVTVTLGKVEKSLPDLTAGEFNRSE